MAGDYPEITNDIAQTSISSMIQKMKKYVFPPQMDFVRNIHLDPFITYIFEFKHKLNKQDLADIWQGVMPRIAMKAEKAVSTIEHPLGSKFEFFGQYTDNIPDNIKWMVFKVKQKAATNYYATTPQTEVGTGFSFQQLDLGAQVVSAEQELPYSYNWPYDFFSLVELAKIDVQLELNPELPPTLSEVYAATPIVEINQDIINNNIDIF